MIEPKLVKIRGGYVEITTRTDNPNGYPIEFDRMNSPGKILWWVHHLSSKTWATERHIREFIETAESMGFWRKGNNP